MNSLSHFDERGASRMVDVGEKPETTRTALASGRVTMQPDTLLLVRDRQLAKGDVLEVARLAGIQAAKRTWELIPLSHQVPLTSVTIDFSFPDDCSVRILATAQATARTGVEMEALTAVAVAGLTIYDMCKAVDRAMMLDEVCLEEKTGGRRGPYRRATQEGNS